MQESYDKGVAIHVGPELCVACREVGCEALVGARAGRVLSPEIVRVGGADAVPSGGRPHPVHRYGEMDEDPTGSETPRMHGNTSRAKREIPGFSISQSGRLTERSGKSGDARR